LNRAQVLRHEYRNAKPWPHVVVENGFPEDFLDAIADEVANIDQSQEASQGFGPATQHCFELVDSESFREFISIVTGVDNLISVQPIGWRARIGRHQADSPKSIATSRCTLTAVDFIG
jgi:hypothetical protein